MTLGMFRWILAVCIAAIVHIAIFWGVALLDFEKTNGSVRRPETAKIEFLSVDSVMEQMTLFDPRPLLLPTEWNYASPEELNELIQEESPIFDNYRPSFESEDGNFVSRYGNRWEASETARDYLSAFDRHHFRKLGRRSEPLREEIEPSLHVTLSDPLSGRMIIPRIQPLYNSVAQEISSQWPGWRPATFLVTIMDSFLQSQTSVVSSSGFEEVDSKLGSLISRGLLSGVPVADGVYFVEIGP